MVIMNEANSRNPAKSEEASSKRMTFAQALQDKYVNQELFGNLAVLPKDKSISTEITLVGFGKVSSAQRQLNKLVNIDLSDMGVGSAGDLKELGGNLGRVQILNLANNFLTWEEVYKLLDCVPNLKELILSKNTFETHETIQTFPNSKKRSLISLTLGRNFLDWNSIIETTSNIWSHIEQIDLWNNQLTSEKMELSSHEEFGSFIRGLKTLRLRQNCFSDLRWLGQIGPAENLSELDVSMCGLEFIDLNGTLVKQLKNLRVLNVSHNNLKHWRSIANLYHLESLSNLLCHENPIILTDEHAKASTIGRLKKLKVFNREEISDRVRRDSEIFYFRKSFPEYELFKGGKNVEFELDHPRYKELVDMYGLPEDLTKKAVVEKYMSVDLFFDEKKISKKLPCDMRVTNLRMLCKRLFKLRPSTNLELSCEAFMSDGPIRYVLDKDGQTLDFFSVKNGQKIYIREIE